jgi:intracellular septation protein
LKALLGAQLDLPPKVWHRLNFAWVAFFVIMGFLNIWVAYTFSTATWVNFKLFGGMGLMLVFMVAQGLWISRYMTPAEGDATQGTGQAPGERP